MLKVQCTEEDTDIVCGVVAKAFCASPTRVAALPLCLFGYVTRADVSHDAEAVAIDATPVLLDEPISPHVNQM